MAPRWPPHGPRECCGIRDVQGGLIESTLAYTQFCKRLREQVPYTRDLKRQNQPGVSGSGFGFSYNYMAGSTLDRLTSNIEGHAQECRRTGCLRRPRRAGIALRIGGCEGLSGVCENLTTAALPEQPQ